MKNKSNTLALWVIILGCLLICFADNLMAQSNPPTIWGRSGGSFTPDQYGRRVDSCDGDGNYYIWNYKRVPSIGLFCDTSFYKELNEPINTTFVAIFLNRRRIMMFGFCRPRNSDGWYWDCNIDKEYLKTHYK